jgi:hypothetical protein
VAGHEVGLSILSTSALVAAGVAAPAFAASGTAADLTISPSLVNAGQPATGTVTLAAAGSTAATVVSLASLKPSLMTAPASVTVPAGAQNATFTVTTILFTGPGDFSCITGTAGGTTATGCLNVNPTPSGPALASVSFAPATVPGGSPTTGTVAFATATDGAVVSLTSSNPAVASVPDSAVVPGGGASAAFPVTTNPVAATTTVTITATAPGTTRTGTLTVTQRPGGMPCGCGAFAPGRVAALRGYRPVSLSVVLSVTSWALSVTSWALSVTSCALSVTSWVLSAAFWPASVMPLAAVSG